MAEPDCGRPIPTYSDADITAQTTSYPPTSSAFGDLHDVQFPYWHVCRAIATCRDIAAMLRTDLEERGDVATPGTMVDDMTKDGAGGWREGNDETIGFDAAWALQKGDQTNFCQALEILVGALEDAWDDVQGENTMRSQNRDEYDDWHRLMLAQNDPQGGS